MRGRHVPCRCYCARRLGFHRRRAVQDPAGLRPAVGVLVLHGRQHDARGHEGGPRRDEEGRHRRRADPRNRRGTSAARPRGVPEPEVAGTLRLCHRRGRPPRHRGGGWDRPRLVRRGREVRQARRRDAAHRRERDDGDGSCRLFFRPAHPRTARTVLRRSHAHVRTEKGMGELLPRRRRAGVPRAGRRGASSRCG